jgi:RavJ, Peptidase domain
MAAIPPNVNDDIRLMLNAKEDWRPGNSAVIDLGAFSDCVHGGIDAPSNEGLLAVASFDAWDQTFNPQLYQSKSLLPPKDTEGFLRLAIKERMASQMHKRLAYECSTFAYSAIALLMSDETVREHFDILQAGSMYMDQGRGMVFAHNISILVPKGEDIELGRMNADTPLPDGSLIIDPWARALGHPVEQTLGVSPEHFVFEDCLYPLVVNYNSALDATFEAQFAIEEDVPQLQT